MSPAPGSLFRSAHHLFSIALAVVLGASLLTHPALGGTVAIPRAAATSWAQRFVGPSSVSSSDDRAVKTVVDASGNVYVTGVSSNGFSSVSTLGLGTLSATGIASATGVISRNIVIFNTPIFGGTVTVTSSPSVGIFNFSYFGGVEDYYTAKYSAVDGSLLWSQRFDGGGADHVADMVLDADGNVIVTGSASGQFCTIKYSGADGQIVWVQREVPPTPVSSYAPTAVPVAVAVDPAGNVAVTGYVMGNYFDYFTVKYAKADGAKLWQQQYDGPGHDLDAPSAVAMDVAGNVIVTGHRQGTVGVTGTGDGNIYTVKYASATGAVVWEQSHYGTIYTAQGKALAVDSAGNVIITGTDQNAAKNFDIYTAKYAAADGALIWEHRYDGPAAKDDLGNAVAVDNNDDVVITGFSKNATDMDIYTAKYAAVDGALVWEQRYDSPDHKDDAGVAIKITPSGKVIITGTSRNAAGNDDFYTASYAAADGALLWERRYDGPAHGTDQPASLAVDASGNAVVTGFSYNGHDNDFYTAKYAAADGGIVWEQRYNSIALGDHQALAVAHDASGNAVVTGSSRNASGNLDFYTAKYAAATGALVWEVRYDGPAHGDDEGRAIAVDASGNVVVTGSSSNGTNKDIYTAKYAAATGALLWERRYNGTSNQDDFGNAVTVDSAGDVIVVGASGESPANLALGPIFYDSNGVLTIDGANSGTVAAGTLNLAGATVVGNNLVLGNGVVFSGGAITISRNWNTGLTFGSTTAANLNIGTGLLALNQGLITPSVVLASLTIGKGNYANNYTTNLSGNNYAVYVVKYAGATGNSLWQNRSYSSSYDSAAAVAVDSANNVFITGTKGASYYTAKYAFNGLPLWERTYGGLGGLAFNNGRALAVDSSGNVIVTGASLGNIFATARVPLQGGANLYNLDYYTAKYAASNGAILWEKRYDGPGGNSVDEPYAVAVDAQGNAVVTGYSDDGTNADFYTAKYASADGALIWEKRYDDPDHGRDYAKALAMDPAGNVVVTGYSYDTGHLDARTVAYGSDGTQAWVYSQPGLNGDVSVGNAVSVDAQGNVFVVGAAMQNQVGSYLIQKLASGGQLLISQPVNTPLASSSTVNFGTDNSATSPSKTFTITNSGGTVLNLGSIIKDGAGSGSYTVTSLSSSSLAPGASTTFTVTFSSHSNGAYPAALHIASDDPVTGTYDILLSGAGSAAATATANFVSGGWATLNGSANPNGVATTVYFQYGTGTGYGSSTQSLNIGNGNSSVPVSINLAGLAKGTTYHYRLVTNSGGTLTYGADQTLTTAAVSTPAWHSAQVTALTNPSLNNMADGFRTGAVHNGWNLYYYKGTDNNIWCVFWSGTQWTQQQLTTSADVADWLAFGTSYSLCCYQTSTNSLACTYYNGSNWVSALLPPAVRAVSNVHISGVPPPTYPDDVAGDIVIDNGWNIIYYRGLDGQLYAEQWNGSNWGATPLGGAGTVKGSVAVDPVSHLIYYQGTDNHLWCYQWTGKIWQQVKLSSTANVGGSIAADHNGLMAYYRSSVDNSAWTVYWNGKIWAQLQLNGQASMSSSATSASGVAPYTQQYDTLYLDNNGQCQALYWSGAAWVHILLGDGAANLTGGLSLQPTMHWAFARRSDGNVVVFYYQ